MKARQKKSRRDGTQLATDLIVRRDTVRVCLYSTPNHQCIEYRSSHSYTCFPCIEHRSSYS